MLSISVYVVEPKIDYLKKKVLNDYRVLSTTSFPKCNSIPLIYHQKDKKNTLEKCKYENTWKILKHDSSMLLDAFKKI